MAIHSPYHVDIIDIRRDKPDESLLRLMLRGLQPAKAEARQLPTLLLYDGIFELLQRPQELTMTQNVVSSFLSRSPIWRNTTSPMLRLKFSRLVVAKLPNAFRVVVDW